MPRGGDMSSDMVKMTNNNTTEERIRSRKKSVMVDLDINKEKRTQKFLLLILVSHFVCILPINILKMVRHSVIETYDNDDHFDLVYIIFVWITFLPTVLLPWFYAHWVLIGSLSRVRLFDLFVSGSPRNTLEQERQRQRQRQRDQERIFANSLSLNLARDTRKSLGELQARREEGEKDGFSPLRVDRDDEEEQREEREEREMILTIVQLRRASVMDTLVPQGEEGRRQSCIPSGGGQRRGSGINRSSLHFSPNSPPLPFLPFSLVLQIH